MRAPKLRPDARKDYVLLWAALFTVAQTDQQRLGMRNVPHRRSGQCLAGLARTGILSSDEASQARALAKRLAEWWLVIEPSQALRTRATQIVERYDLRAADSLQLAAALEWCGDAPQTRVFLAADKRLREAALRSGFDAQQV